MAYTLTEATKLILPALQADIVETLVGADPLLAGMPLVPIQGDAILYNEELALSDGEFVAINGTITPATRTYTQRTKAWKQVISDQSVAKLIQAIGGNPVDQLREAVRAAVKGVARKITNKLITGDEGGTAEEYDGLDNLSGDAPYVSQLVGSTTRKALSYDLLDQLIDMANLADITQSVFVMPRRTIRSFKALVRAQGGTDAEYVEFGGNVRTPSYYGIPIVWNDNMSITRDDSSEGSNDESRIYLLSREEVNGACLFVPKNIPELVQVEMIPTLDNQDNMIARAKAYIGFAVRGPKHFAWAEAITN